MVYSYYCTLHSYTRTNIAYMVTYGTHMINTYVFRLSQLDRVPESKRLALLAPTSFTLPLPPIFSSLLSTRFHVASQRAMTNPDRAIEHDWFCIYSALAYAWNPAYSAPSQGPRTFPPPSIPLLTLSNSAWWGEVAWQVPQEEHRINQTSVIYCFVQPCRIVQYLYTPSNTSTELSI